ncbi:unnamed protein product [Ostreobium quekettii]|uniref:Uncharacterized protein n=1 Tax=Ostreobium quekettii TaxID=121088 RepID=A0A8S1ITR3_9CHLO|nr:unnamed protein product [Ostreobium quekettii]|eukprot:evm.model.scf_76.8 EVM.evm.TU.scf_76.8   scf_76:58201-61257(-)
MGPPPARIADTAQPPKPDAQPKGKGLQPAAPMDQPAPATTRSPPGGSAGRGRGRGGGRTTNALGLLRARKSGKSDPVKCEAAIAAAKVDNTRIVVIALLNEKPYSMKAIQQAVLDSYHQAKQRKIPAKEYILRLVPHLSTFSLAGKYVLKDGLAKEVLAFMEAQPKGEKAEKAPAATAKEPARVGQKRPLADRDKNMKRLDHATGAAPRVDRSKVPRPGVRKHPQPECPGATMENSPSATPTERQKKATKRPRLESSAGKDRAPVAPVVDMVETTHSSRERDSDEMMNDHPVPAAADNSHSERRQTNGFSMNNGIPGFLETGDLSKEWFSEFVDRNIEIVPEISSVEEFTVAQAEFQRRYAVYIRLNQLIERNRLHFTTLMGALAASVAEEEQNRLYQQLQDEWTACMQLSLQWDGAFKILHEELGLMRSRLEDFAAIHGSEFVGVDGPERTGLAAGETSRSPT